MAKKAITMSFQTALRTRFKSRLVEYGVNFTERKVWKDIGGSGFKQIAEVQYVMDEADLAVVDMNDSMMERERIPFEVREHA